MWLVTIFEQISSHEKKMNKKKKWEMWWISEIKIQLTHINDDDLAYLLSGNISLVYNEI